MKPKHTVQTPIKYYCAGTHTVPKDKDGEKKQNKAVKKLDCCLFSIPKCLTISLSVKSLKISALYFLQ